MGMAGAGGWMVFTIPGNANEMTLRVNDIVKYKSALELRHGNGCNGKQVTVHKARLYKDVCTGMESEMEVAIGAEEVAYTMKHLMAFLIAIVGIAFVGYFAGRYVKLN